MIKGFLRRSTTSLDAWSPVLQEIESQEHELSQFSEEQLRKAGLAMQFRARSGEPLDDLLPSAFALIRESGRRMLGMKHYDVQLVGGIAMHRGSIVEMQTGEGKTLTATLPLGLAAMTGKGAHIATANDYLAQRDAELMRPLFHALGLSVGIVQGKSSPEERATAYRCDITYGTAKEFGFDFLRERLSNRDRRERGHRDERAASSSAGRPSQVARHFVLVDEADALLIDEARTPLIVSATPEPLHDDVVRAYQWADRFAVELDPNEDFEWDESGQRVMLTSSGRRRVRGAHANEEIASIPLLDLYGHVELAQLVHHRYQRDRHYVLKDDEVVIVDEFTGRLSEGRRWRDGIHQALEAKEQLEISPETGQAARITIQNFFQLYSRLCGMTGTAANATSELRTIYDIDVVKIPTHRPPRRVILGDAVYGTEQEKWLAIAEEIREVHHTGQPVLVGTRSIDKSEHLGDLLKQMGIAHDVLNANNVEDEAEIVAGAGQVGRVTVATNMAGRGTDIRLGEGVEELGGLYVIGTELHESQRIDRQLIGRCGRQGDPGIYRQFLSLEDDIIGSGYNERVASRSRRRGAACLGQIDSGGSLLHRSQQRVERRHFRQRKLLMENEKQKQRLQTQMGQDPYLDSPS